MFGSLLNKTENEVRRWTASYLRQRRLDSVSVDTLLAEADKVAGTATKITKTKIRKAASRLAFAARLATALPTEAAHTPPSSRRSGPVTQNPRRGNGALWIEGFRSSR